MNVSNKQINVLQRLYSYFDELFVVYYICPPDHREDKVNFPHTCNRFYGTIVL